MMAAARRSATVLDRRILRVLDADARDDVVLRRQRVGLRHLPRHPGRPRGAARLPPRRLDRLRGGRLDRRRPRRRGGPRPAGAGERADRPDGSVRVIGFSVDAALHGLPPGRLVDRRHRPRRRCSTACSPDAGPGVSRSAVPAAPRDHGRVLRPRQVRAGVPRPLDALCDEVLNPRSARPAPGPTSTPPAASATTCASSSATRPAWPAAEAAAGRQQRRRTRHRDPVAAR